MDPHYYWLRLFPLRVVVGLILAYFFALHDDWLRGALGCLLLSGLFLTLVFAFGH